MGQLHLLAERRFWPLFWTQFLGAFNDNLFKNSLAILIAYRSMTVLGIESRTLVVACAGIFILPFFLFSATAGQLADRLPKSSLMRAVKAAEIGIMALAGVGFATGNGGLLLVVLFLMGLQSTFFGPAKYSILPELLDDRSIVGGNALIGTATFMAILLGTILGGLTVAQGDAWVRWLGVPVVAVACAGLATSVAIVRTEAASPRLRVQLDPVRPTLDILAVTRRPRAVFMSILGISWFWLLGASFLSLLPNFCKDVLGGGETVVTWCLSLFCVGIAAGSLLCDRLSRRRLELGLVPLGSIGITVFAFDLGLAAAGAAPPSGALLSWGGFLAEPGAWRVSGDLFAIAVFSGFYTVPLYTLVQQRSARPERSRVIAGLNIINSGFMVASSLLLVMLLAGGVGIPGVFLLLAVANAAVALYIYAQLPEFLLRFAAWILANLMYRLRVRGIDRLPEGEAAVLTPNHASFVDWLLLAAASPRPLRFVMHHSYARLPIIRVLFRDAKVIPIASAREDPELLARAMERIAEELKAGELVCLFPEGGITPDGQLQPFRRGIEKVVARTPVKVYPVALKGLWGSYFSRHGGRALRRPFRRVLSRVEVEIGEPLDPAEVTAAGLAARVAALGGWAPPAEDGDGAAGQQEGLGECGGIPDGLDGSRGAAEPVSR